MGGAVKRMLHPYEVLDFSFEELSQIMLSMWDGSIQACEKVDGINMTWKSDMLGFVAFARNHGHIKQGGLSYPEMVEIFENHPGKEQFMEGINAIRTKAHNTEWFSVQDDMWLNTEIISSRFPQSFRYDTSALVIHNAVKFEDGLIEQYQHQDLEEYVDTLNSSGVGWNVHGRLDITLNDRLSEGQYDIFLSDLRRILRKNAPDEADFTIKISDYVWEEIFMGLLELSVVSAEWCSKIADHIVRNEAFKWSHLVDKDDKNYKAYREICLRKNRDKVVNKALSPIRLLWEKYSALALEDIKSHLIKDEAGHRQRMQELIDWNFDELSKRMSDPIEKTDKVVNLWVEFNTHLARYESLGVKPPAIEGIVFKHPKLPGKLLKATGAFPSLNRVCGVVRYGLGLKKQ